VPSAIFGSLKGQNESDHFDRIEMRRRKLPDNRRAGHHGVQEALHEPNVIGSPSFLPAAIRIPRVLLPHGVKLRLLLVA
jgi:hypothetical protein